MCFNQVTGLKILGSIGTYILCNLKGILTFKMHKNIILCILKGISPFKMHKIIFFPENLKKILGFNSKLMYGQVTLNLSIFLLDLKVLFYFQEKCLGES